MNKKPPYKAVRRAQREQKKLASAERMAYCSQRIEIQPEFSKSHKDKTWKDLPMEGTTYRHKFTGEVRVVYQPFQDGRGGWRLPATKDHSRPQKIYKMLRWLRNAEKI